MSDDKIPENDEPTWMDGVLGLAILALIFSAVYGLFFA